MELKFKVEIYDVGINACVDVPESVAKKMTPKNGNIKVKGTINGFEFFRNLTLYEYYFKKYNLSQ
jgi:hypothetical protein